MRGIAEEPPVFAMWVCLIPADIQKYLKYLIGPHEQLDGGSSSTVSQCILWPAWKARQPAESSRTV